MPELRLAWSESWLWLGGSLLLAVLWANLTWFLRQSRWDAVNGYVTRLTSWRFSPWVLQLLRLLYYVGVPFAALLWGRDAVVGRLLGLQRFDLPTLGGEGVGDPFAANWFDWAHDVGWAVTLGAGAWILLALGWWAYRLATAAAGEAEPVAGGSASGWLLLREAAFHEVHWAFYRNAPILTVGTYWGAWIGLILVAVEAALNPAWRKGLTAPQRTPGQLVRGALAIVSSVLFLLSENLWLALVLHWAVSGGLAWLTRALPLLPAREPNQASAR